MSRLVTVEHWHALDLLIQPVYDLLWWTRCIAARGGRDIGGKGARGWGQFSTLEKCVLEIMVHVPEETHQMGCH